jgi:putative sigma-54 modulation protein
MQINFTGHQIDVTDALKDFTNNKFTRLERHFDRINKIDVIFYVEKLRQIAEANISIVGAEINAKHESPDMYATIDGLVDKLDRQLLKHKEKQQKHRE